MQYQRERLPARPWVGTSKVTEPTQKFDLDNVSGLRLADMFLTNLPLENTRKPLANRLVSIHTSLVGSNDAFIFKA